MSNEVKETPLTDHLARVPEDARAEYEHGPTEHSFIPYGRYCKQALALINSQAEEIARLREQLVNEAEDYVDLTRTVESLRKERDEMREQLAKESTLCHRLIDERDQARCARDNATTLTAQYEAERDEAREALRAMRYWLDNNTIHYDVDPDWPVEGNNMPVLQQVSNRIWYHATNDIRSWPFSEVIDAAIGPTDTSEQKEAT